MAARFLKSSMILCTLWAGMFSVASIAQDAEIKKNQSEIKEIQKQIKNLEKKLKKDEKLLKKERTGLQEVEQNIASIEAKITATNNKQKRAQAKRTQLQAQAQTERERISAELERIDALVRSQHSIGENSYLKLLLSPADPASVERSLVYYKYLAQYSSEQVIKGREQVKTLASIEQDVAQQQTILDQLADELSQQQQDLHAAKTKRTKAIAHIDNELTRTANRVGRLQEDEKRITKLVKGLQAASIARAKARAKAAQAQQKQVQSNQKKSSKQQTIALAKPVIERVSSRGLGKLKGKLTMPIKGSIVASYGSAKQDSGLKWNGLMLSAAANQPVKTIYDGQVVYADWFKGFGQLVIVDHGEGYMSLYSHNNQINRNIGDLVKKGDVIAYSGTSGGLTQPGLYFEVRYNGEPRDPLLWVKR